MLSREIIFQELRQEEGCLFRAYLDSKKILTVGIGHNCKANPTLPIIGRAITHIGEEISEEECFKLFNFDLDTVIRQLDRYLPWWKELDGARQYVMISMTFNMGINSFLGFHNTLKFIQQGNYYQAYRNMLKSKWATDVKSRSVKLSNIMLTGQMHPSKTLVAKTLATNAVKSLVKKV